MGLQFNPLNLSLNQPKFTILFAAGQLQGERTRQEDYFTNFNDECFVVTDGVSGMPHGDVASNLACDTAIWGYKLVRQRPFYWKDKRRLTRRMVRSTNLAVWQKRRETGFEDGLGTTLLTLILTDHKFCVGNVGDSSAFLLREGKLRKLTKDDVDDTGKLTKYVGKQRLGLIPQIIHEDIYDDDTFLLATDGLANYCTSEELAHILTTVGTSNETMTAAVERLLKIAQQNGSTDNMTACIVKRIPLG